jgi:hypothetical protein
MALDGWMDEMDGWMAGWLVGWPVGWLVAWPVGWLAGLAGWCTVGNDLSF